jgi:hypothetical protein
VKIGLIGPAEGKEAALRRAAELLIEKQQVDQAIYLGLDDTLDRVVSKWAQEIMKGEASEEAFLDAAAKLARAGSAEEIEKLLASDQKLRRLTALRTLPPPPARAIEMIDDRIVLVVHDKAILDEEDIANAYVIVYGRADDSMLKRFGPRYFFTPGPLRGEKIGMIEVEASGAMAIAVYDPSGKALSRETLQARTSSKMMVTR